MDKVRMGIAGCGDDGSIGTVHGASHRHSLDGEWELIGGPHLAMPESATELDKGATVNIPAQVPGNVEVDLVEAGLLKPLEIGEGAYQSIEYEGHRWFFRKPFKAPELKPSEKLQLVFEGIDTVAEVFLNGHSLGKTRNMLIPHSFEVGNMIRQGEENELVVRIDPVVVEGRKREGEICEKICEYSERAAIRKAAHMYGWDILPRIVSAGLWRPVYLKTVPAAHWRQVYAQTLSVDLKKHSAEVSVFSDFVVPDINLNGWKLGFSLVDDLGSRKEIKKESIFTCSAHHTLYLEDIDFWWPRGMGDAKLYKLHLELFDPHDVIIAEHQQTIGIRTVELIFSEITTEEDPGEFVFIVNGEKVFIKGTNHVPLDALHGRDNQHLDAMLSMTADLNCNMIRIWGGGVYETDAFYERCDELGLMIWHDFMFGCALYPQTQDFLEQVREEAEIVVKRLRHHASMALWSGNNENDVTHRWSPMHSKLNPNDERISREILPEVLRRLDPLRSYLPSSPYVSQKLFERGNNMMELPEDHLWGPRDDFKGSFYMNSPCHFVSEIGYHGAPCLDSLEQMIEPEHLWPFEENGKIDSQWRAKSVASFPDDSRHDSRIRLMAKQVTYLFNEQPSELESFLRASQISQAEAKKFFIERFRMAKWRRTGILWWNIRDGWPLISDAVVDYYNRPKLAYAYIKRVQQDVCVMVDEAENGRHKVIAVNDTLRDAKIDVFIESVEESNTLLTKTLTVPANGRVEVGEVPHSPICDMYLLKWQIHGASAGHNHYLAGPRPFNLEQYTGWVSQLGLEAKIPTFASASTPITIEVEV
ncbi:MAG: glycoside hydrolase family 2 [Lentisphaeria bacterium]|nr:glycoside hydrolase family 2 [Lentisphaeria bacterium]